MFKRYGCYIIACWLLTWSAWGALPAEPSVSELASALPADLGSISPKEFMERFETLRQADPTLAASQLLAYYIAGNEQRAAAFDSLIDILLANGALLEATDVHRDNLALNARLTYDYYNYLYQYYRSQDDQTFLLEWLTDLQTEVLPQDLRIQAFGWLLEASRAVGPVDRLLQLLPKCLADFDVTISQSLLIPMIQAYAKDGDKASAEAILDAIVKATETQPNWQLALTMLRVEILFTMALWPEAESAFQNVAAPLPDAALNKLLNHALTCAAKANQLELQDRLCSWVLEQQSSKSKTMQTAAQAWLGQAKAQALIADIPARLGRLLQINYPDARLIKLFFDYSAPVMKDGQAADLQAMIKLGEQLAAGQTDEVIKSQIDIVNAQHYFVLENFAQTLKLMEQPHPSLGAAKQDAYINKIKAHLALQQGNKQEAVERFRAFMDYVKNLSNPELDPLTNLVITQPMCLGLNAKRIGDILGSQDDTKGMRAAYQEAERYYAAAAQEFKADSAESKYIQMRQAELAKLLQE